MQKTESKTDTKTEKVDYEKRIFRIKLAEAICTGLLILIIIGSLMWVLKLQINSPSPSYKTAAEICNTYTGIILGFVAMAVSLIGMMLSFHNTKQSEESNLNMVKEFTTLTDMTTEIKNIDSKLSDTLIGLSEKMEKLNELQEVQRNLEDILREIRISIDSQKGSSSPGATAIPVNPSPPPKDRKVDDEVDHPEENEDSPEQVVQSKQETIAEQPIQDE